jgi:CheY-like chemotaxis protein
MFQEGTAFAPYPAHRAGVDLNKTVRNVLRSRAHLHVASNIGIKLDLAENLPDTWANSDQIDRVLLKLIMNAEEAVGNDLGRHGFIQVKTSVEHGRIHVLVIDNGRGIHSREMARLFKNENSYVDLIGCAEIAQDHGGELYAWSSYGKGSVFTLELPIHVRSGQEIQPVRPGAKDRKRAVTERPYSRPVRGGPAPLQGKRILVIDDEVHVGRLVSDVLETQGAHIDLANSGLEAVEQIKAKEYDLFICDQHMPDLSGEKVYWSAKSVNPRLHSRFLFVTGDVLNEDTNHFFMQTGARYLRKPFRTVELVAAVEQALNRSRQPSS